MIFASDNQTYASEQVMAELVTANRGFEHSYGEDHWTNKAIDALKDVFECDLEAYFVATGTAANCLSLACLTQPWEVILCHASAHVWVDESTAPEFYTAGARMLPISRGAGKLSTSGLQHYFDHAGKDLPHNAQAKTVSITQASELGLVYTPDEIKAISSICKQRDLHLHMDGARFANALVSLNCSPAELTWKSGVDVLCLGATKCGALCVEAIIFFNKNSAAEFNHRRKRSGHLVSKGRLFGAQIVGWLRDDHWLDLARHANRQAAQFAESLSAYADINIVWPVESNQIFATMPRQLASSLLQKGAEFYDWNTNALPTNAVLNEDEVFVRLVTSFVTEGAQREEFLSHVEKYFS